MDDSTRKYLEFADLLHRRARGETTESPDISLWHHHFEHQNQNATSGLGEGELAPEFTLPDHTGVERSLDDVMGEHGLLLVFARSVWWCHYCRNHLAELAMSYDDVRRQGVEIVAITPDPPEKAAAFAEQHNVPFPILCDRGGRVIDEYGLLNPNVGELELQSGGLPFPGQYLVRPDKVIARKAFTGDLRHRVSGTTLVREELGYDGVSGVAIETDELRARIRLATDRVFGGQEFGVDVEIETAGEWHVYGPRVPEPYTPIAVRFEGPGAELLWEQHVEFPPGTPMTSDLLGETLPVLEGTFHGVGRARLRWSPPPSMFVEFQSKVDELAIAPGAHTIAGVLRYQACDATTCAAPREVPFEVTLEVLPNATADVAAALADVEQQ